MEASTTQEILNVKGVSALTGWSPSFIRKLAQRNEINYYRPTGKTLFFETSDVLKYIRSNRNKK